MYILVYGEGKVKKGKLIKHKELVKIFFENGNDNIRYLVGEKNVKGTNIIFLKGVKVSDLTLRKLGFTKWKTRELDKERSMSPKPQTPRDLIQKNSEAIMDLAKLMIGFLAKQDKNWKEQREFNKVQKDWNATVESKVNTALALPAIQK